MPGKGFDSGNLIFPRYVQRAITLWGKYGPLLRWVTKFGAVFMAGYVLRALLSPLIK